MARPTRDIRRPSLNMGQLTAGDFILLGDSIILFFALVLNWWISGVGDNSLKFSEVYFFIVLILLLLATFLIVYPMLQSEMGLRKLPVAIPPLLIVIGCVILLTTTYEFGRYNPIEVSTVSPGFGLWLAFACSWIFLFGALVKWGTKERQKV